jgi:OHCU decarboxylase
MHTLAELNAAGDDAFVAALGSVFEHSPWVAECASASKPFESVEALHRAMTRCVQDAPEVRQLALIRAHPELAGREAAKGELTADSSTEQGRLGFTALSREELERMKDINARYRERFGFPCIVALALHSDRASVMTEMESRIGNDRRAEIARALDQVGHIARARLKKMLGS